MVCVEFGHQLGDRLTIIKLTRPQGFQHSASYRFDAPRELHGSTHSQSRRARAKVRVLFVLLVQNSHGQADWSIAQNKHRLQRQCLAKCRHSAYGADFDDGFDCSRPATNSGIRIVRFARRPVGICPRCHPTRARWSCQLTGDLSEPGKPVRSLSSIIAVVRAQLCGQYSRPFHGLVLSRCDAAAITCAESVTAETSTFKPCIEPAQCHAGW